MFTIEEREAIRSRIIDVARADVRISGGAITGSYAVDKEDRWSDIDLAFGVREGSAVADVLRDFSDLLTREYGVADHLDVPSGTWIYRVFLLENTLQVDLAFAPERDFGAKAPTFKLVFGDATEQSHTQPPSAEQLIGWAWLYALHARSSIERNNLWQAEYMISAMRDQVLSLACLRLGLPAREGRGIDSLPDAMKNSLESALVRSIDPLELKRAFQRVTAALVLELEAGGKECLELMRVLIELSNWQ